MAGAGSMLVIQTLDKSKEVQAMMRKVDEKDQECRQLKVWRRCRHGTPRWRNPRQGYDRVFKETQEIACEKVSHLKCYQEIGRLKRQLLGAQGILTAVKTEGFPENDPELSPLPYDLPHSWYWDNLDLHSDDPMGKGCH